jgi:hypothetical protein
MKIDPPTDTPVPHRLQMRRVILGLALTPLLPGFYSTLLFGSPWAFPISLLLAYPTALLLGLPLLYLFGRRNWLSWWQITLCGGICVLPLQLLYWQCQTPPHLESFSLENALLLQVWGLFAGLAFWLLAVAGKELSNWRDLLGFGG